MPSSGSARASECGAAADVPTSRIAVVFAAWQREVNRSSGDGATENPVELAASVKPTTTKANATFFLREQTHPSVELRWRGDPALLGSGQANQGGRRDDAPRGRSSCDRACVRSHERAEIGRDGGGDVDPAERGDEARASGSIGGLRGVLSENDLCGNSQLSARVNGRHPVRRRLRHRAERLSKGCAVTAVHTPGRELGDSDRQALAKHGPVQVRIQALIRLQLEAAPGSGMHANRCPQPDELGN